MASTIVLMQSDAFRDGLLKIVGWLNYFIDCLGIRDYLPLIWFVLLVLMISTTIRAFMRSLDVR